MKKYVDLHMHTTNSDGSCDMNEIIEKAKELGLKAISITDHDTTNGYKNYDINNRG
ncbi:MAG: PHP domain-containing protein, partial [Firmicutes bacterium]|nr:PHP domain-containing protein [Bacillota bacterium]